MNKIFKTFLGVLGFLLVLFPAIFSYPLLLGLPMDISGLFIACVVGGSSNVI